MSHEAAGGSVVWNNRLKCDSSLVHVGVAGGVARRLDRYAGNAVSGWTAAFLGSASRAGECNPMHVLDHRQELDLGPGKVRGALRYS